MVPKRHDEGARGIPSIRSGYAFRGVNKTAVLCTAPGALAASDRDAIDIAMPVMLDEEIQRLLERATIDYPPAPQLSRVGACGLKVHPVARGQRFDNRTLLLHDVARLVPRKNRVVLRGADQRAENCPQFLTTHSRRLE